jgi:hypothetical protein
LYYETLVGAVATSLIDVSGGLGGTGGNGFGGNAAVRGGNGGNGGYGGRVTSTDTTTGVETALDDTASIGTAGSAATLLVGGAGGAGRPTLMNL